MRLLTRSLSSFFPSLSLYLSYTRTHTHTHTHARTRIHAHAINYLKVVLLYKKETPWISLRPSVVRTRVFTNYYIIFTARRSRANILSQRNTYATNHTRTNEETKETIETRQTRRQDVPSDFHLLLYDRSRPLNETKSSHWKPQTRSSTGRTKITAVTSRLTSYCIRRIY